MLRSAPRLAAKLLLGCGLLACGEPSVPARTGVEPQAATLPMLSRGLDRGAAHDEAFEGHDEPALPGGAAQGPALDGVNYLTPLFAALEQLRSGGQDDVRVVHFGDSHVAADLQTGATRRLLQREFGNGGRGFVALGTPWKGYIQEGVRGGPMRSFAAEFGRWREGRYQGDGLYGLSGVRLSASKPGASAISQLRPSAARTAAELYYWRGPGGGSFEVLADGRKLATVNSRAQQSGAAYTHITLPSGCRNLEVRTLSRGEVRVFGAALDDDAPGVVYDAIGRNGARAAGMLDWDEALFNEQLARRKPHLVVLAYGTNEAGDDTSDALYTQRIESVLGRVRRAVPQAACMLVGPPDRARKDAGGAWSTMPRVIALNELQRGIAARRGCAFYDQLHAMGGPGTVARWVAEEPPRARPDHVHYTRESYEALGARFAQDLLDSYRTFSQLPPETIAAQH